MPAVNISIYISDVLVSLPKVSYSTSDNDNYSVYYIIFAFIIINTLYGQL